MLTLLTTHPWAYPLLEVVHLVGISLLLGNLVLFELRMFGLGRDLPIEALARLGLPLAVGGFALAAASGLLMFVTQAQDLLANRFFVAKVVLVMVAGLNAAAFHARGSVQRADRAAKAHSVLSLALWLAVLACGRGIAYA